MSGRKKTSGAAEGKSLRSGEPADIDTAETVRSDDEPEGDRPATAEDYHLCQTISDNIRALINASGYSQREFSALTGIAPATLSGYLKCEPDQFKLPPVNYLYSLCRRKEFSRFHLDIGDFLSRKLNFEPGALLAAEHNAGTYIGCYYTYYYKYATAAPQETPGRMRKLRIGVLLVYENPGSDHGLGVMAKFFDSEQHRGEARKLKDALTAMMKDYTITDMKNRFKESGNDAEIYNGRMTFTDNHYFITLECAALGDSALMVFNLPTKPPTKTYLGGLGCVNSVSRGNQRLPVAQRVIITRCALDCTDAAIAQLLSVNASTDQLRKECASVTELLRSMYGPEKNNPFSRLSEADRLTIVNDRLANLVSQYLTRNHLSILAVGTDDNYAVYRFILSHCDPSDSAYGEVFGPAAGGYSVDVTADGLGIPDTGSGGPSVYV